MKVGIIGGGITGLTTALALHKLGIQTVVYEQAAALNEIGAGIWLQPNAIKVFNWLGLKDSIKERGIALNKMEITDTQLKPIKPIKSAVVQDEEGNQTIAIHRGLLQKILYDEVVKSGEVQLNKKYVKHSDEENGIKIHFEDGEEHVTLLLGADGIGSTIRKGLFPASSVRSAEQVCWRGVAKMKLPAKFNKLGQEAWGKQIRFGFSQISKEDVYWFAVANASNVEKASKEGVKSYLTHLFKNFSPVIGELIANTAASQIHQAILHDLNRLPLWHQGNVCLMGDAAHATTPNMGQGACQGIEDAYYMSSVLSASPQNTEEAFQQFEKARRKKVDYVVNTSWQFGKMAHSRIGQPLMKMMMKLTPESVISSQMNKLYAIDHL